jgi:uncharacterized protein with beta-barrel porin domain/subtilisin family serine protease
LQFTGSIDIRAANETIQSEGNRWMIHWFVLLCKRSMMAEGYTGKIFRKIQTATLIFFVLFLPLAAQGQEPAFYPNDPYFFYDSVLLPEFPGQWHLINQGPAYIDFYVRSWGSTKRMINAGVDAGLSQAWRLGYTGKGIIIGIVDSGVDSTNYDIAPGYRADLSKNFSDNDMISNAPQGPQSIRDNHGTAVAGVAAARGGNAIGGTGAAPYASIAGLRINLGTRTPSDPAVSNQNYLDVYYWKSGVNPTDGTIEGAAEIQVKNHSYGADGFEYANPEIRLALERTANNGVIHVFAAGNDRGHKGEDASKEPVHSVSGVLVAAALGSDGKYANYSSYGASVFVTAPSSRSDFTGFGITTTDRTGDNFGYNSYSALINPDGDTDDLFPDTSYCSGFGGTSSAAPLVSGIMALGKEANPEMDVRMAKHALVKTSTLVDPTDSSDSSFGGWRTNAAGNKFNPNYGFGNINAGAFVQKVLDVAYITEQNSVTKSPPPSFSTAIPDNDTSGVSETINLTAAEANQPLEGVEVGMKVTHTRPGDLTAKITSPSGMESRLFYSTAHLPVVEWETTSVTDFNATFLTNAFWGENGTGNWTLNVADIAAGFTGTWLGYNVTFLMGEMVMLTPGGMTQSVDINAQSLTILSSGTTYQIPIGRTFRVRNNVRVDGGTLVVNGQITEAPGAFGNLFSLDSGTVGGIGLINASRGFYNNGGTVSPGNSIGTMTITGDYHQGSQGKLTIEIASDSSRDLLAVIGSVNLNGTLQMSWTGGYVPALNTNFGTFLTATGGVNNYFSNVLTNITPTIIFQPKYDIANQVYFVVERDYINTTLSSFLTPDQSAVGAMLNSLANTTAGTAGDLNTVLTAVDDSTTYGAVAAALDQIKPKGQGAMFNMGLQGASYQSGNIAGRLEELRYGSRGLSVRGITLAMFNPHEPATERTRTGNQSTTATDISALNGLLFSPDQRWGIFASGNYGSGTKRGDDAYSFRSYGATIGADYHFTDRFSAGITVGSYWARTDIDDSGSKVDMDHTSLGAYGTYKLGGFYAEGHVGYGWNSYKNDRKILFPGISRIAHSTPKGSQIEGYGGIGDEFLFGKLSAMPYLSLQYVKYNVDSYVESGADSLNLSIESQTAESLRGKLGGRISYDINAGTFLLKPSVWSFYVHEFGNETTSTTARLALGGDSCTVTAYASPRRDFFQAGAGISAVGPTGISAYLNYNAHFDVNNYQDHSISAGIRWEF